MPMGIFWQEIQRAHAYQHETGWKRSTRTSPENTHKCFRQMLEIGRQLLGCVQNYEDLRNLDTDLHQQVRDGHERQADDGGEIVRVDGVEEGDAE